MNAESPASGGEPKILGLGDLLAELVGPRLRHPVLTIGLLIAAFEFSFVLVASIQALGEYWLNLNPACVVVAVWGIWTYWHSYAFERRRIRYLQERDRPYRTAFLRDIFPWVVIGFAQMWRSLIHAGFLRRLWDSRGAYLSEPQAAARLGVAIGVAVVAMIIMITAIRDIGIGNAAFLAEFRPPGHFVPVSRGIYAFFPHPLFWSGVLFSGALATIVNTRISYLIVLINAMYAVLYGCLEGRRLGRIFGANYAVYERGLTRRFAGRRRLLPVPSGRTGSKGLGSGHHEISGSRPVDGEQHEP